MAHPGWQMDHQNCDCCPYNRKQKAIARMWNLIDTVESLAYLRSCPDFARDVARLRTLFAEVLITIDPARNTGTKE